MRAWRMALSPRGTAGLCRLDLPRYDALRPDGANINLAIGANAADPVSGAASHRCYPCEIIRLTG